ncbi:MAG: undecaprenyl/decaprenyl-phosphate alpha-N-acetylglucosaminyl 1-phosphate transferase, partial [Patescibacteria group bacterium]|nr:undecaprenyl/decaprenyl-phosphate alpha-N-acetylglucosaminyl 1-phosphate transferase [Patescibacteria group bacterium]
KMTDEPKKNKHPNVTHTYTVPRGGGIPILIALLVTSFIFLPLDQHLRGILLGAAFATIIGLFDDRFNLNPYLRLLTSFITAGIVVAAGIGISFISSPFSGIIDLSGPKITFDLLGEQRSLWILADLFALFWIAWCMNFIGWSGGVEGQLPGVVVMAALTIGLLSLGFSADITQWPVAILAAITAGAYLGFLPFNFYPQKIMPGYSGKSLAGFLLATLSILATAKIGTLVVVLGVPLIDAFYTIIRRISQGHSPFWGDRGHLHHKLLDLGWSKKRIAVSYWGITFVLGILALNLNSQHKLYTMITITTLIGGFLLWITYFTKSRSQQDQDNG